MAGKLRRCPKCNTPIAAKRKRCEHCRKRFYSVRRGKYCSQSCKTLAYRKRKKEIAQ
jgi:hypothetical protein